VKERLYSIVGREGKMGFLRKFRGVGPKYARNIMMDGYHPEFRESIAIDSRIKRILKEVGHSLGGDRRYGDAEGFLLAVAHDVGIEGWDLDRLLYLHTDDVLKELVRAGALARVSARC
jgi:hypothetical protein